MSEDRIDARPSDRDRLPPGQIETRKWPVLHYSSVPKLDTVTWTLRIFGEVEHPFEIGWDELMAMPMREVLCDIHCVTTWSRFDNVFRGVPVEPLLERAVVKSCATH